MAWNKLLACADDVNILSIRVHMAKKCTEGLVAKCPDNDPPTSHVWCYNIAIKLYHVRTSVERSAMCPHLHNLTQQTTMYPNIMCLNRRIQKFSKNLEATSKFSEPDEWHKTTSALRAHKYRVPCELHCHLVHMNRFMFLYRQRKTALIMLKTCGTTM